MTTKAKEYVIDASVAVKWFLDEVHSEDAHEWLLKYQEDLDAYWCAPELFYTELSNALYKAVKRQELDLDDAQGILQTALEDRLVKPLPSAPLLPLAIDLAHALKHDAVYDCLYLAMALEEAAVLVTADKVFFKKVAKSEFQQYITFITDIST